MTTQWQALYSERGRTIRGSAVRDIFAVTQQPGMISFAGGMPAPEAFPCEQVAEAFVKVMREQGTVALQYGATPGHGPLRQYIAGVMMADLGLRSGPENVLITSGGVQVLDLIPRILLDPGDAIVVEAPTFLGALASFDLYGPRYLTIPVDNDGAQVDGLDRILAEQPGVKFIYVMPTFHNPAGCTLSAERRQRLVELAAAHGVPIIEDDPYAQLRYSGEPQPPLIVLDQQRAGASRGEGPYREGNVLYVGSFSKILSPGMRLGWVAGPASVVGHLARAKQGVDLHTSLPVQMTAFELCQRGFFPGHIERIRELYRQRRDKMLSLMQEHFPAGVSWTRPDGGLFIWVTLPKGIDAGRILAEAIKEKVAFVPGQPCFADGNGLNTFRLNFSNASLEQIEQGITRLAAVLRRQLST
jgi:2-aminoadipate transaminase